MVQDNMVLNHKSRPKSPKKKKKKKERKKHPPPYMLTNYTLWPNKNASILFGIIFQKLSNKNEKLFYKNNK